MKKFTLSLISLVLIIHAGCTYKTMEAEPVKDCVSTVPDSVSFNKNVLPLLNSNCSNSGCHSGTFPAGGLNLESSQAYNELSKSGSGYIDTINPERSVLYSSMVSETKPMPPTGKLDDCSIEMVAKWMKQKGKEN